MSYCLNPACQSPQNPSAATFCQGCGSPLMLKQRYRARRLIGQGGFGRTFLAVDEYLPSKPDCVIKQFFPQDQGLEHAEKAAELFQQEAMRLDDLGRHPQIATLLAYFDQDRRQYLVQEFIDGRNLTQELEAEGPFSEEQIWQVLAELLPVLQFLHDCQVIHRDVKPENIIRRVASERVAPGETLVLVDFGAAKLATGTALQRTGTVIGSAGYTAPEQLMGKAIFASDLYSLGVTCLHLLTEVPPFDLFDISEGTWVWRDRVPVPVSHSLGCVLDKLLHNGTRQRYQSANEVLQDRHFQASGTVQAQPATLGTSGARSQPSPANSAGNTGTWRCIHTINAHNDQVRSVAFSPDGQLLASGSYDFTIKIRHFHTGEQLPSQPKHLDSVLCVAFSADGEILASASYDAKVKLWNPESGTLLRTLHGHKSHVWAVSFSPDGKFLASCSADGAIKLWEPKTGKAYGTLARGKSIVQAVTFSPDSQTLASCSYDRTIKLWDLQTGQLRHSLGGNSGPVRALAFSPDGKILASGGYDRAIRLRDANTGEPLRSLTGHTGEVWALAFSPDGKLLASGSYDQSIKLWNPTQGTLLATLSWHDSAVWSVTFSPDSQTLVSGSGDCTIKVWQRLPE